MKKSLIAFLVLQIITCNGFAEELFRIPGLFGHYLHHAHEHGDVSGFFDFIQKHYDEFYQGEIDHDHDDEQDANLPFKHCKGICINFQYNHTDFIPSELNQEWGISIHRVPVTSVRADFFQNPHLNKIWQPPKTV